MSKVAIVTGASRGIGRVVCYILYTIYYILYTIYYILYTIYYILIPSNVSVKDTEELAV